MSKLLKFSTMLFFSATLSFILSCEGFNDEKNKKIETALLLEFINYSGTITYDEDDIQQPYSNYASGFYSSLISGTMIDANSDTIANRYIMISFNSQTAGAYTGAGCPADDVYIIIADGYEFTWASNRAGGNASIAITKYGAVGDTIEGTFNGTLRKSCGCSTLAIKNGKFAVRRTADQ
jgi:hypothetical protein